MKISFRRGLAAAVYSFLLSSGSGAIAAYSLENDMSQCKQVASQVEYEKYYAPVFRDISNLIKNYPQEKSFDSARAGTMWVALMYQTSSPASADENAGRLYANGSINGNNAEILKAATSWFVQWADRSANNKDDYYFCLILPWRNILVHLSGLRGASVNSIGEDKSNRSQSKASQQSQQQPQSAPDRERAAQKSAEQKRSEAEQLQDLVQETKGSARTAQARADAAAQRAGRRTHNPAAVAHDCIQPSPTSAGMLYNACPYKVNVTVCAIQPHAYTGALNITDSFSCEDLNRGGGGLWTPEANRVIFGMNGKSAKGGLQYFACKDPAYPVDSTFNGSGIVARCR